MKVIKSYTELNSCLHNYDIFYKSEKYKLRIPEWDARENNRISNIINNYNRKSGCNSANFFMSIAFILYAVYYFCKDGLFLTIRTDKFIWLIIYAILCAVTGKLLGLTYTRWKMIKFMDKLLKGRNSSYEANSKNKSLL